MSLNISILGELSELITAIKELLKTGSAEAVAVVMLGSVLFGVLIGYAVSRIWRRAVSGKPPVVNGGELDRCEQKVEALAKELERFQRVTAELAKEDAELWRLHIPQPPAHLAERLRASRTKVVLVGHLKGGVGKTTLISNLLAYFETNREPDSKKVLVIDFDYQASLTATLLRAIKKDIEGPFSERLLTGETSAADIVDAAEKLHPLLPNTRLIPAAYTLAQRENQLMLRWALQAGPGDIRYNLAEFILSPVVQDNYRLVLIDMGPRLTMASVQALATCVHVIVPTILDQLSAEAVGSFLEQLKILTADMRTGLRTVSIVGTMTREQELSGANKVALEIVLTALKKWGAGAHFIERHVPFKQAFIECAGNDIAYLHKHRDSQVRKEVRDTFDAIGQAVREQIGL